MHNLSNLLDDSATSLPVAELAGLARNFLLDAELSDRSPKTIQGERDVLEKLQWWLARRECTACGVEELRGFFLYLQKSHTEPGGRWGNPAGTRPLKPRTIRLYFAYLRAFFNWCVAEKRLSASPLARIPKPRDPGDEVQPFTEREVSALLHAAEKTQEKGRDTAILLTLLDTGLRAQELVDLKFSDVDFDQKSVRVREGKGGKGRTVYLGKRAVRALWRYTQEDGREDDDPLFCSQREGPLTYWGLRQIFRRLGKAAGVKDCHAHRMRHSFAVSFLKAGGSELALMRLLGHTTVQMSSRYVQWAQADLAEQHRAFSPADRLKGTGK